MQFGTLEEFAYREMLRLRDAEHRRGPGGSGAFLPGELLFLQSAAVAGGFRSVAAAPLDRLDRRLARSAGRLDRAAGARGRYALYYWACLWLAWPNTAILDVGCGSGGWLRRMQRYGFRRLTGVDPFAPIEIEEPGFRIVRADLSAMRGIYGMIMMNHVLEHLADPAAALACARDRLAPGGRILVRVPLAGSFAHREYGASWYNLDAPRHLVVPTEQGLRRLAERTGLAVRCRQFDSQEISLLASGYYRQGITGQSFPVADSGTRKEARRLMRRLDRRGQGDFGVFVLERAGA